MMQMALLGLISGLSLSLVLFWVCQLVRVCSLDSRYFESHSHRLLWFLVVLFTVIFGAVWFFFWKRGRLAAEAARRKETRIHELADSLKRASGTG